MYKCDLLIAELGVHVMHPVLSYKLYYTIPSKIMTTPFIYIGCSVVSCVVMSTCYILVKYDVMHGVMYLVYS